MKKLGISIYPNKSSVEEDLEYIQTASKYGFERIFTCLLSVEGDKEKIIADFKKTISFAKEKEMEVICDISPRIFDALNISYQDLSFFADLGVDGIRLDMGFTGNEEAMMTYNSYGLSIEINMSNSNKYLENLLSYQPNLSKLTGCHNFYPHRYAGLSYEFFIECSQRFKQHGLRTAAFVSSNDAAFGPWPIVEGLPTVEMHRELPIDVQAKHLFATNVIDNVIISNAYASEAEMERLSEINKEKMMFTVDTVSAASDLEKEIIFHEPHYYRGDVSDYMIRSTQSRVKNRGLSFPAHHTPDIKRGDIIIESDLSKKERKLPLQARRGKGEMNLPCTKDCF